jgi:hypothetical protein
MRYPSLLALSLLRPSAVTGFQYVQFGRKAARPQFRNPCGLSSIGAFGLMPLQTLLGIVRYPDVPDSAVTRVFQCVDVPCAWRASPVELLQEFYVNVSPFHLMNSVCLTLPLQHLPRL